MDAKEKFIKELQDRGFNFDNKNIYYKVIPKDEFKDNNLIGVKVGAFTHSCHIETMDFIVLMFLDLGGDFVKSYWEKEIEKI